MEKENKLHLLVTKVFQAQRRTMRPHLSEAGLSVGQPKVLHYLKENESCTQRELARCCDIEPATVSKMLDAMEREGLIERLLNKEDRRAFQIRMTEEGCRRLTLWDEICKEINEKSLHGFSEEAKEQFMEDLGRMYRNLTGRTME